VLAIADVWHRLPSELALRYMPELRTRAHVTPADLFMFDVAATARWADLKREHEADQQAGKGPRQTTPAQPALRPGAVRENGADIAIRGNEIPPWDARFTGKR
jgi:hypothetical protein